MPRKPTKRGHTRKAQRPQPAFSRMACSIALISSARKFKRKNNNPTVHRKATSYSTVVGSIKEKMILQNKQGKNHNLLLKMRIEGVVQADFAFFDPKPDDFHGVKVLLQTYLDNKEWDLSSFVDLILQQTTVGTVIKIEEDEDNGVYGFISALNMHRFKDCE